MSNKKLVQTPLVCHGHTRPIVDLQFSPVTPDGYFLTSASKDGQPMLRNGETGDWIGTFQGHKGAVWACVLNDTAQVAATASADFSARVWNAITGDELHSFEHKHIVRSASFAHGADTWRLCTGGMERLLRIFDLTRPDAEPAKFALAPDHIRCTSWIHDNNLLLVSYSNKPNVDVWDVRTQQVARTLESKGPVSSIEVTRDGRYIVTADGTQVDFRDLSSFDLVKSHVVQGYEVECASFAPDKGKFVAGGTDMWVHLYDYETGEELECSKGHHGPVHCVQFAPGAATYASGSEDGTIRIWRTDFLQEQQQAAAAAAADANGSTAAAAAEGDAANGDGVASS